MIRGILKPMPDYQQHLRAGVTIPKAGREFIVDEKAKQDVVDKEGEPLVLSKAGYEYMKLANGTQLMIEPIGGAGVDSSADFERRVQLEQENETLRARVVELEAALAPKAKAK